MYMKNIIHYTLGSCCFDKLEIWHVEGKKKWSKEKSGGYWNI